MTLQDLSVIVLILLFFVSNSSLCDRAPYINSEKRNSGGAALKGINTLNINEGYHYSYHDESTWTKTFSPAKEEDVNRVFIKSDSSRHSCDVNFLSVTLGSNQVLHKFAGMSFGSKQLQTLARGLSPCYLRLGGTSADFLTFHPEDHSRQHGDGNGGNTAFAYDHLSLHSKQVYSTKDLVNFTLSGDLWKKMTQFFQVAGWNLIFDFNLFKWRDGYWDPSNAQLLLNFSDAMGYDIAGFQLGNEPNSFYHNFNFSIDPPVLVKDFGILKNLISRFPRYRKSPLFGPDVTDLFRHSSSRKYLEGFLHAGGGDMVAEISLHQYYKNGRTATVEDFYDVTVLDELEQEIDIALQATQSVPKPLPIRFTETSSCYGGGAPGLSDAYVAGFLWLDKLGLSAKRGVTKVFRQTFFGGNYGLLSPDAQPNPDYFLSLLHKRLILGPVFNVTVRPAQKLLRVYAHCARTDFYSFPQGSMTLAYLNIAKKNQTISLSQFHGQTFYFYSLTPGDENGLKSRFVKLNGGLLKMQGDRLPALDPSKRQGEITLPALTFGFIVIPEANVSLCKRQTSSA